MSAAAGADLRALAATDVKEPIPADQLLAALLAPPFVHIAGTFNARDVGSVPGSGIRPGLVFRSGALNRLTDEGRAALSGRLGVRRVFDLRSRAEHHAAPDPDVESVQGVWAESAEEDANVVLAEFVDGFGERGYSAMYLDVLKVYGPSIRAVLEHVRDREGEPFLFHCTGECPLGSSSTHLVSTTPTYSVG